MDNRVVTFPLNITGKQDEGNYTCVASNGVGDSATENVSVIIDSRCYLLYFSTKCTVILLSLDSILLA